jgi:hypothetical protein
MSWEVSLSEVNAGMPLTVDDMYTFGEQSLYLIKVNDPYHFPIYSNSKICLMIKICYTP